MLSTRTVHPLLFCGDSLNFKSRFACLEDGLGKMDEYGGKRWGT